MSCFVQRFQGEVTWCMGYWPSVRSRWLDIGQVLFLCVFMDWDKVEVHKLAKKGMRPISSHLDRTNLANKGFIIWLSGKFFLRNTAGSPEQARWFHLAHSGSQSQHANWFILPACRSSHIIRLLIISSLFFSAPTQSQQTLITRQSLELGAELGQGEFGSVLKGVWRDPKGNKVKENFQLGWRNFLTCLFNACPQVTQHLHCYPVV